MEVATSTSAGLRARGSAGSVVVIWSGSNTLKQLPVNGTTYNGNANYGTGDQLLATNYYVVYSGPGTSVSVSNILSVGTYNVAVFSYAGSGGTISYNQTAPSQSQLLHRAER